MNLDKYPVINVINIFRGFPRKGLPYKITPYKFMLSSGQKCIVEEIRQFHSERSGKGDQMHYTVRCRDGLFYRLVFETRTLTWRLLEGGDQSNKF